MKKRSVVFVWLVACGARTPLGVGAHATDAGGGDAIASDAIASDAISSDATGCTNGTTRCGDACVDEHTDPNHCGACGSACASGDICSDGVCVAPALGRITCASAYACAVDGAGGVHCWGSGAHGNLGNGTTATATSTAQAALGLTNDVTAINASDWAACALTKSGDAYCWGSNFVGQCGIGTMSDVDKPTAVTGITTAVGVAGADDANCVLLADGSVRCMGEDLGGQLALGSVTGSIYTTSQSSQVTGAVAIGGTIGANMCAVLSTGHVVCWGRNTYASLGDGTTTESGTPIAVSGITNAVAVAVSFSHVCALLEGGGLACWGDDTYGGLGDGTTTTSKTPVMASVSHVAAVSVGQFDTCIVTTSGAVECVGYNDFGELGNGTTVSSTSWQTVIHDGAVGVACGDLHVCALLASGKALCWGRNDFGQLGNGTTTNSSTPTQVIGF